MTQIGYARVLAEDQGTDPQVDELKAAGCARTTPMRKVVEAEGG